MGARDITSFKQHQKGAVLVITLIILVIVTIISVMGMRSGILELRMSSNEEQRTIALQIAQSALDKILERPGESIIDSGTVSNIIPINCTPWVTTTCKKSDLTLKGAAFADRDGDGVLDVKIRIFRIPPYSGNPPRIRGVEYDVGIFRSTYFQVESEYNSSGSTAGYAKVFQGQLILKSHPGIFSGG